MTKIQNFSYWFKHWISFQRTSIKYKCWKFDFLLHDIEKPWMLLFMHNDKVQKWHKEHSNHHFEGKPDKVIDYVEVVIDWECARFTKPKMPLNAYETLLKYHPDKKDKILPIIEKLGIKK